MVEMAGRAPTSRFQVIFTVSYLASVAFTIWALTTPIKAESGADWECAARTNICDDRLNMTATFVCGIPDSEYPNLSLDMQCSEVVSCRYDVSGKCLEGDCNSGCPGIANTGDSLEVVVRLSAGDTCTLTISPINTSGGTTMIPWTEEVANDCSVTSAPRVVTGDVRQVGGLNASGCKPTTALVSFLISTLCTLVLVY